MPNTVTNTRLLAGQKKVVQYVVIDSDGTEETDLVIYDSSAVATVIGVTDPLKSSITSIEYSTNSLLGVVKLEWDASTDVLAWAFPANGGTSKFDFSQFGGLKNTAGTGITGDILLTTTGLVAGDAVSLVITVDPNV